MDVRTQPLIAQDGNIRVDPYASSNPQVQLPPSVQRTLGHGSGQAAEMPAGGFDASQVDPSQYNITADQYELTPEELAHIQAAASKGDKESWDILNALKLPLGVAAGAAALYGATRGGLSLVDAVGKAKGMEMVPSGRTGGVHAPPSPPKLLPNPIKAITDQTGTRMQQPAPRTPIRITDQRPIYEKTGGKLPTGAAAGDALRAAARAVRR